MRKMTYLILFLWILVFQSVSSAGDASRLSNLSTQIKCAIDELPAEEKERLFPWELIRDKNFKDIYVSLIKNKHLEGRWLLSLSGPAPKSLLLNIDGEKFVYTHSCKQHECGSHVIHLLFAAQEKRIYGLLIENNSTIWLGNPSGCTKEALEMFAHK